MHEARPVTYQDGGYPEDHPPFIDPRDEAAIATTPVRLEDELMERGRNLQAFIRRAATRMLGSTT